jgi:hypothetical protein
MVRAAPEFRAVRVVGRGALDRSRQVRWLGVLRVGEARLVTGQLACLGVGVVTGGRARAPWVPPGVDGLASVARSVCCAPPFLSLLCKGRKWGSRSKRAVRHVRGERLNTQVAFNRPVRLLFTSTVPAQTVQMRPTGLLPRTTRMRTSVTSVVPTGLILLVSEQLTHAPRTDQPRAHLQMPRLGLCNTSVFRFLRK